MVDQVSAHQAHLELPGETEPVRLPADLEHLQRLADAMAPDPREWNYTGEVVDAAGQGARCVCGHPIRWVFPIRRGRDGVTLPIGSTCIETSVPYLVAHGAEGLAERLQEATAELRRRIQREATKARRVARESEHAEIIARLEADWAALQGWQQAVRDAWYREHGPVYPYALCIAIRVPRPTMRTGATIKRLIREYHRARTWISVDPDRDRLPPPPTPQSPELQETT